MSREQRGSVLRALFLSSLFLVTGALWILFAGSGLRGIGAFLAAALASFRFLYLAADRKAWLCWAAFALVSFPRISVVPSHHTGWPRFVPYVMGYPDPELLRRASRGEVVLGGCVRWGSEPRWVLLW